MSQEERAAELESENVRLREQLEGSEVEMVRLAKAKSALVTDFIGLREHCRKLAERVIILSRFIHETHKEHNETFENCRFLSCKSNRELIEEAQK